jgi:tRNA(Ile)-lysidine synthase
MSLHESILKGLNRIGIAVSGGADSVFLLHALAEKGLASAVLHVNHKLRGQESDVDEQFVRDLAAELALPIFVASAPLPEGNTEQEARTARYTFFEEQIAAGHCEAVATGHTQDDQAETVLSRFLRGAGTAGLSGIRPKTANHVIRPLLNLRREEIRASLRQRGIPWREDASNQNTAFLRNRIRHEILPLLETLNPSLTGVLASSAEWAQGEEEYWQAEIAAIESSCVIPKSDALLIRTGDVTALPPAVQRRLIRRMIERVRGNLRSIDFRHGEAIRELTAQTEGSGRLQLPDLDIYRSFDWLRIAPVGFDSRLERNFEVPLAIPGLIDLPERGIHVEVELSDPESVCFNERVYNEGVHALDKEKCAGTLVLRNWQPGDRHGLQENGAPKIKTLFQEHRIPLWERRNWPVIARDQEILWTRRFGASGEFAAGPESKQILLVRETVCETGESNRGGGASIDLVGHPFFRQRPRVS